MPSANDSVWTSKVMSVLDSRDGRCGDHGWLGDGACDEMRSPPAWTKALPRGS